MYRSRPNTVILANYHQKRSIGIQELHYELKPSKGLTLYHMLVGTSLCNVSRNTGFLTTLQQFKSQLICNIRYLSHSGRHIV